jgi:glycosyltransferase involved in cell wall biosynthesis
MASDRNLRLVHYYPRALVGDGGCSYSVRGWATAGVKAGADVVVAYDQDGDCPQDTGVEWRRLSHRRHGGLRVATDLPLVLHGADFLVLHSGWVYHNVHAARVASRLGVPYVLTPHGAYDPNVFARRSALKRMWWALLERHVVVNASGVHVFFEEEREFLANLGYAGPFVVAPSGVTIPHAVAPQVDTAGYVLWMGRFDLEHKGVDLLLHALASLPPEHRPPARLHGPDWRGGKRTAMELVRTLGLESSVTIGPAVYGREKWQTLANCKLFVFPSRWEAQGIVALEAAGVGSTLVVTGTTFVGQELARRGAAILAESDPESIASAIVKGWSSDTSQLRLRAAHLVRERYSWTAVAVSYLGQLRALS